MKATETIGEPLSRRRRTQTAHVHQALAAQMALALVHPNRDRAIAMPVGFHGLVVVVEPLLAQVLGPDWTDGHEKRATLVELGVNPAALPICENAASVVANRKGGLGVLHVLEGSSLGGNLIAKPLRKGPAQPAGKPTYFASYGGNTGALCKQFAARLDAVIAGANATFFLIGCWFAQAEGAR